MNQARNVIALVKEDRISIVIDDKEESQNDEIDESVVQILGVLTFCQQLADQLMLSRTRLYQLRVLEEEWESLG